MYTFSGERLGKQPAAGRSILNQIVLNRNMSPVCSGGWFTTGILSVTTQLHE
jgi:hypothetical protein